MLYTGPKGSTLKTGPTASLLRSSRNFKESLEFKWAKSASVGWFGWVVRDIGPQGGSNQTITAEQLEAGQYVSSGIGAGSIRAFHKLVCTHTGYSSYSPLTPTQYTETWEYTKPNDTYIEYSKVIAYGGGSMATPMGVDHVEDVSEVLSSAPGGFSAKRTVTYYDSGNNVLGTSIWESSLEDEIFIEDVIAEALSIYEGSTPIADCGQYGKQFTLDADGEIAEGSSGITGNFGGILYPYIGTNGHIPWQDLSSDGLVAADVIGGYYKVQAAAWRIKKIPIDVSESPHNNAGDPEYENKAFFTGYYELKPDGELWNGIAELTP